MATIPVGLQPAALGNWFAAAGVTAVGIRVTVDDLIGTPAQCSDSPFTVDNCAVTYSQPFTIGVSYFPGDPQVDEWNNFATLLNPAQNFVSVNMSGTFDPAGVSCSDPSVVAQLAGALFMDTSVGPLACDGFNWEVSFGGCGTGHQLVATTFGPGVCGCSAGDYIVRPEIANPNWGGMATSTCVGPTQVMTVRFTR